MHLQSMVVRRNACRDILFNETVSHAEDRDFSIRLALESKARFAFTNEVTGVYYRHRTSLTSDSPENSLATVNAHIELFSSYLERFRLRGDQTARLKRILLEKHLQKSYFLRRKSRFLASLGAVTASMQYGFCTRQLMETLKTSAAMCRIHLPPGHRPGTL
jgi:hypothetical protein